MSIAILGGFVVLLFQNFVLVWANTGNTTDIVATFSNPYMSDEYNRLVVYKDTGNVYVGAVNRIYQLDKNLQIIQSHVTAGQADKNVNEVLVIDYERKMLIACGSAAGDCVCLNLDDITKVRTEYNGAGTIAGVESGVVAFIGPGRSRSTVLQLGTSKRITGEISDRSLVPAEQFQMSLKTEIVERNRNAYGKAPINFVFGFRADGCSYYLLNNHLARVVRVNYTSGTYSEIEISCVYSFSQNANFLLAAYIGKASQNLAKTMGVDLEDDILFATFTTVGLNRGKDSFVCLFALKNLKSRDSQILQLTALGYRGLTLTSISAATVGNNTILFLGTSTGRLKRLTGFYFSTDYSNAHEGYDAVEYDDEELNSGNPILPGMPFDNTNEHIYVTTKQKIFKIRIKRNCSNYETCEDCVKKEPSCEWCTAMNSCLPADTCLHDEGRSTSYIHVFPFGSDKCHLVNYTSSMTMKVMHEDDIIMLNFTLPENLSDSKNLKCKYVFSNETIFETFAKSMHGMVFCLTPPKANIPEIPSGEHLVSASLFVNSIQNEVFINNFTLYDCSTYNTCTPCVASQFNCTWCFWEHRCKEKNDCGIKEADQCPSIKSKNEEREHLIPYGTVKRLEIQASLDHIQLDKSTVGTNFHCRFNIIGRIVYASSILFGDSVHCDAIQFTYNDTLPSLVVPVDVVSNLDQRITLDNPSGFIVVIYRCNYMANDCKSCHKTDTKFGCGWCEGSNQCTVTEKCHGNNWTSKNQGCPSFISFLEIVLFIIAIFLSVIIAVFVTLYRRKSRALRALRSRVNAVELQLIQTTDETNFD